jgi:uracil-DNA glycosylase
MSIEEVTSFPDSLPPQWRESLSDEANKPYFKKLTSFLINEYRQKKQIYPKRELILRALQELDYDHVRVVVLGQDPYHGEGQAIGRSFAVPNSHFPKPPSLQNIFKELHSDLKIEIPKDQSDLSGWAKQGVLLLNTVLTVRHAQAFSHRDIGWELFTDEVIKKLNDRKKPLIFILWGSSAHKKKLMITNRNHFILESAHPSPLSAYRGFFGSRPFSKVNEILISKLNERAIDWAKITD